MTGISLPSTAPEAPVWRGFGRRELDAAYDNSGHVKDSAARLAEWTARSATLRAARPELLDRRYGPRERNRLDIFRCGRPAAPLLVFIHGGYWQRNSKEVFSCMADGPLAHGFDVALPGYTLGPEASLSEIVAEIATALGWLRAHGPALGVAAGKLVVSGWSAGGHLAALACGWPEVDAGLPISGIYDLEPIRLGVLNEKLHLSSDEVRALSPMFLRARPDVPVVIAFGEAELSELRRQSQAYGAQRSADRLPTTLLPVAARNHFTILDELSSPAGALTRALGRLIA